MDQNNLFDECENISEEDLAKKNRRNNIIAFIICTLLAFTLWLMIRNADADDGGMTSPPVNNEQTAGQVQ